MNFIYSIQCPSEKNLTFVCLPDRNTLQSSSIITVHYNIQHAHINYPHPYSNISFMTHRQNSITIATAQSQRPSSSAIDASTHADKSHSVTPSLQQTPLPPYIWADHNSRPHPFIQDENTWRLMCFEVEDVFLIL